MNPKKIGSQTDAIGAAKDAPSQLPEYETLTALDIMSNRTRKEALKIAERLFEESKNCPVGSICVYWLGVSQTLRFIQDLKYE